MNKKLGTVIIVALLLIGISFYGGMKYGQSKTPSGFNAQMAQNFRNGKTGVGIGATGANRSAGFTTGLVLSKDATSITVKTPDGGSKIIIYSGSTEISKFASGTIADIIVGQNISVNGQANSDGSVTAQTIQIRPAMPVGQPNGNQTAPATK
ncbi:MAG: hypothetical protein V1763_01745 [Parcubacteria group bacterium]